MKPLNKDLQKCLKNIEGYDDEVRYKQRSADVRAMWAEVVEDIFLEHTNTVYIMTKNDIKTLIVYVDESIFSAELNARRELIKLQFLQHFNEKLDAFEIYISRGDYKKNHPFKKEEEPAYIERAEPVALSLEEKQEFEAALGHIDNEHLKQALKKALMSDLEWKKGIREKKNEK